MAVTARLSRYWPELFCAWTLLLLGLFVLGMINVEAHAYSRGVAAQAARCFK